MHQECYDVSSAVLLVSVSDTHFYSLGSNDQKDLIPTLARWLIVFGKNPFSLKQHWWIFIISLDLDLDHMCTDTHWKKIIVHN